MQINWIDSFKQRLLFESGQSLVKQIQDGEDYHLIKLVYGLGLLVAINFDETDQWYHHYQLLNLNNTPREIIEHLQLIFMESKKLRLLWLRFMREINQNTQSAFRFTIRPRNTKSFKISRRIGLYAK